MARPHQQDVSFSHRHALRSLGFLEIAGKDVLAGLEPVHAARPGNVEQHATTHDSPSFITSTVSAAAPSSVTDSLGLPL